MSHLHFAQIREDSWIEHAVAEAERPRRSVVIASGGCTALSLLTDHAEEVFAIDASLDQCALVELRKVAVTNLSRDRYLAFIGEHPCSERARTWSKLAPQLPAYARDYWGCRPHLIAEGVQHAGTTERYYRYISSHLRTLLGEQVLISLLESPSIEAQQALFARHFDRDATRSVLRVLLSKSTHLLFFPAFMFEKAQEHDFSSFFIKQFEQEVTTQPLRGNYFLSQLFFERYVYDHARGLPPYLTESGYARAQRNVHKLKVRVAPLHEALSEVRDVDAFFLSNVFDWCTSELMEATCRRVLSAARPFATLLYRNMLSESTLPACIARRFERDEARSQLMQQQDRSFLYRRLSIGGLS